VGAAAARPARGRVLDDDAGEPVQADDLDDAPDLRLRAADADQAPGRRRRRATIARSSRNELSAKVSSRRSTTRSLSVASARERALRRRPRVAMSSSPEQRSSAGCAENSTMERQPIRRPGLHSTHAYARRGRGRPLECHRPGARPRLRRARAHLRGRDRRAATST
jgi:hypothetical protein